jgi:hypothetical protein
LPIFQDIQTATDTMDCDHKFLFKPLLASHFKLPDEGPLYPFEDMTNLASVIASDGRSSPLLDALEVVERTVIEANRAAGVGMYDVIMKEQLDQQEGGAMSRRWRPMYFYIVN